ncbi:hypothetical protein QFC22_004088 [Naganishia vaughanmartiniae]|uniref:Uncharacterized protein n=1 Tax=Naganishia vaughanmartiniae TaxID=1424756 RepID=A0ACC2X4C1_9TREE|nr:hypothetical protein QFC22_004088 [Naganishia vaughanmartiniae]
MPLTPLPRKRILTAAGQRTSKDLTGMSLPRPASSTLPYRRPRYRWKLHSIRSLCRAYPVIVFFVAIYFLLFLRPLWLYATHAKSHGFLAQPIPANHHIIGFLHRYILPSFLVRILYRFGSGRSFAYQFPIPEITHARPPSEWPLPELTRPVYRPRRRLRHRASTVRIHDEAVMNQKTYYELISPAYLAFHTFSIANSTNAREFRDLSRQQQRKRIPEEYTHLIDWQFVLASPPTWAEDVWAELEAEQAEHGDLLVLDEFAKEDEERMAENMNDGKTYRWMQEVIKRAEDGRGRSALWVMYDPRLRSSCDTISNLSTIVRTQEDGYRHIPYPPEPRSIPRIVPRCATYILRLIIRNLVHTQLLLSRPRLWNELGSGMSLLSVAINRELTVGEPSPPLPVAANPGRREYPAQPHCGP